MHIITYFRMTVGKCHLCDLILFGHARKCVLNIVCPCPLAHLFFHMFYSLQFARREACLAAYIAAGLIPASYDADAAEVRVQDELE